MPSGFPAAERTKSFSIQARPPAQTCYRAFMKMNWLFNGMILATCVFGAAGCVSSSPDTVSLRSGIPPKAQQVGGGTEQVIYTAAERGRMYLYDATENRLVGTYEVRPGQRFAVDGKNGRATLDGNEVTIVEMKKGSRYEIYALPE
jgi:hypothetical protein